MKIRILPSSFEGPDELNYLTTYLINGTVAIDAGCIGIHGNPEDQRLISHIFLTHCHADHIGTLPVFLENVYGGDAHVSLYGHPDVLDALRSDIFNGRIWPDFTMFESKGGPFVRFVELEDESPVEVNDLRLTPVRVDHMVTTFGYLVEDGTSTVVFGADSGPTGRIWEVARKYDNLRAAFIEVSFPGELEELALRNGHLTPDLLREEIAKLPEGTRVLATHIKPKYRAKIIEELESLRLGQVEIISCGNEYLF